MNSSFNLSFIDYFTGLILAVFAFFFLSFMLINEQAKGNIIDKSEFFIEMTWADNSSTDMDLWMENPRQDVLWYNARDIGLMTLDRDQTGMSQNVVSLETGQEIRDPKRREVANIRSFIPGKYSLSSVYFRGDGKPVDVTLKVIKLNPYVEVYEGTHTVQPNAEKFFVSFIVDEKGNVVSTDTTMEVKLTSKYQLKAFQQNPGGIP